MDYNDHIKIVNIYNLDKPMHSSLLWLHLILSNHSTVGILPFFFLHLSTFTPSLLSFLKQTLQTTRVAIAGPFPSSPHDSTSASMVTISCSARTPALRPRPSRS